MVPGLFISITVIHRASQPSWEVDTVILSVPEKRKETCWGQIVTEGQSQNLIQAAGSRTAALNHHCCLIQVRKQGLGSHAIAGVPHSWFAF